MHEQSFKPIAYVPNNPFSFQQVFNRDRGHQIVDKLVKSRKAPVVVIPAKAGMTILETFYKTINFGRKT